MNLRKYIGIFLLAFGATAFLASCLNDDNKIPPNCYDGVLNNGEYKIDCGGPNCPACDHCIDDIWQPSLGETYYDCGGECAPCDPCWNGVRDGDEVGIDCGGSCNRLCSSLCGDGILNGTETELDCGGSECPACPTCTDQIMNGDEVGIDCGGSECNPCATSNNCTNGIRDGDEFWADCGGTICPDCVDTLVWYFSQTDPGQFVAVSNMTVTVGTTISAGGTCLNASTLVPSGTIAFSLTNPNPNWSQGQVFTCNAASMGTNDVSFVDEFGVAWTSSGTTSECIVTMVRYVDWTGANPREFFRLNFTGTLADPAGNLLTFTAGVFQHVE